jgi:glycosyltransferase involved in cell wall biosynthesis
MDPSKGIPLLLEAWQRSGSAAAGAELVLVGAGPDAAAAAGVPGVIALGPQPAEQLRAVYAGSDVLVLPSIPTRTFLEPWGLVVNEAMNQRLAVIATDAVGAAAGGLVRDGRNGLVVAAGEASALAAAITRLREDARLRESLAGAGARDVQPYSHQAWVDGLWAAVTAAFGGA